MKNTFEDYKNIQKFLHPGEPLKGWINEENYSNIYFEDWNALMEVVDKIEDSGYNVLMEQCFIEIIDNSNSNTVVQADAETKFEATYKAVVEFLKLKQ